MIRIRRQILVVDNDLATCQSIREGLRDSLTEVCCITSAVEALTSYMKQDYCLVILDIQLDDIDSMELLKTMRCTNHTPILVLTAPLTSEEIITLLNAGADTYLEKPLNIEVCVAQANALMRLYIDSDINHEQHQPLIRGAELIVSPRYRQVMVDGKPLELSRKEFDLLHCLAAYPGQVFSRGQIYSHIWDDEPTVAVDEAVKSLIKKLRKKLATVDKDYIQNMRGVGYKFVLPD